MNNIIAPSFTIYPLKQSLYLFYGGDATGKSRVFRDAFSNLYTEYESPVESDWKSIIEISEISHGVIIIFNNEHLVKKFISFYHKYYSHKEMWYEKYQNYYKGE